MKVRFRMSLFSFGDDDDNDSIDKLKIPEVKIVDRSPDYKFTGLWHPTNNDGNQDNNNS